MAKKKKRRLGDKVLMPHVSDEAAMPNESTLSDEERRVNEKVDDLFRDLFGEDGSFGASPYAEQEEASAPVALAEREAEDGILEESDEDLQELSDTAEEQDPLESLSDYLEAEAQKKAELVVSDDELFEEELTLKEQIESSADDFKLLLDLDYEDELGNAIGFEKIRTHHEREINGRNLTKTGRKAKAKHADGEFDTQSQDVQLRRAYTKRKLGLLLRIAVTSFVLVFLLFYERAEWMAKLFGGISDGSKYPVSYILIGVQLLLLSAAVCYKPLCEGLLRLVRFSPCDYSLFSVIVIATLIYHAVLLFLPSQGYPLLYLSPAALSLCVLAGVEMLNWYRQSAAFDVISARHRKFALMGRVSVGNRESSAKQRLQESENGGRVWHIRPVGFVRNYFANTAKKMETHRNFGALVLLLCAISLAFGFCTLINGKEEREVLATVFFSFLLCVPAVSLLLTSMPMFFATLLRLRGSSAIIGEEPIATCGEPTTLELPDQEIFAAMEHEHLRLAPDCDAHRVSVLLRALLDKLRSPLAESFSVDEGSRLDPAALSLTEIAENGVCAELSERNITVQLGTVEYLEQRGVVCTVRRDLPDELAHRRLCVALNGVFAAVFAVRYTLCSDVPSLLQELHRAGVRVAVYSKDPGVRCEVLQDILSTPLRVVKPDVRELELRTDRVDATVVALGSCKEAARAFAACRRVRRVGRWGKLLQALTIGVGAAIASIFTLLGSRPSGFTLTVWMLLWCVGYGLISYLSLRRPVDEP